MGMSASQARYLSLIAQQSNLEYQGQQINQERAILSQQVSELYNSLLAMNVPTPPSTQDFTTVEYSGKIGATSYSFDASTIKPGDNGNYIVTVEQDSYGDSLQKNSAIAAINYESGGKITASAVPDAANKTFKLEDIQKYWVKEAGQTTVRKANVSDFNGPEDGKYTLKAGITLYTESSAGESLRVENAVADLSINGHPLFDISSAGLTQDQQAAYEAAIKNSGLVKPNGENYLASDFYIYFDDKGSANFVLKSDMTDGNNNATTYAYTANGSYSKPTTYKDCKLTFDPASGRITEIAFPNYRPVEDEDGNTSYTDEIISYTTMSVTASTVTDEIAYKEAFAKYEYAQYEYDKTQQEINAKTEVIQQQDRNLELRLQRLDTQRTQITTELEAVEKVLNDNIEQSYKTFSG